MQQQQRSSSDDHWEVIASYTDDSNLNTPYLREREQLPSPPTAATLVASRSSSLASLPPGASPPVTSPNILRPASPFSLSSNNTGVPPPSRVTTQRERDGMIRRKPQQPHPTTGPGAGVQTTGAAAIAMLKSLDPFATHDLPADKESKNNMLHPEDSVGEERKERKGFWGGTREKDREKDRDKDKGKEKKEEDGQAELTRMIGTFHEFPARSVIKWLWTWGIRVLDSNCE